MKRIIDIVLSSVMLVLFFPIGLLLVALIFLADGSPVFYGQERIGKDGKTFQLWKFRTMRVHQASKGVHLTRGTKDPRITTDGALASNSDAEKSGLMGRAMSWLRGNQALFNRAYHNQTYNNRL